MVQHGYNTTFDGQGNQLYAVNGIPFVYMNDPIRVRRGELVRIYLVNILEYDPINSFHLHGNFFDYYPTGTRLEPTEYTDTVVQAQGQRGICEVRFPYPGRYMFHAHKTEFADLGWMGFFDVVEDGTTEPPSTRPPGTRRGSRCAGTGAGRARPGRRSAPAIAGTAADGGSPCRSGPGHRSRSSPSSGRSWPRARSS